MIRKIQLHLQEDFCSTLNGSLGAKKRRVLFPQRFSLVILISVSLLPSNMPTSQAGVGSIWQLGSVNQKVLKGSRLLPGPILQKQYVYRWGPSVTVAVAVVSHHHAAVLFLLLLFKSRFNFGSLQTAVPGERDRDHLTLLHVSCCWLDATCLWMVSRCKRK